VWDILEECIYQHPVMLNRAPTLHRMGIQAFEPVLVEGNAIKIHPLVCKGFNADFDGDQMAVHLPLSIEAQTEAHVLMLAPNNIFSPANGSPIITPSQDIVLGTFYITSDREGDKGEFMIFNSVREAIMAYELGKIRMHSRIFVRLPRTQVVPDDKSGFMPIEEISKKHIEDHRKRLNPDYVAKEVKKVKKQTSHVILTTVGRCIFNDILPAAMPFYNYALTAKGSSRVIADTYAELGRPATIKLLDDMKSLGFKRSTLAALSFGITDIRSPDSKQTILDEGQKKADRIEKNYKMGAITDQERYAQLIDVWGHARKQVTEDLMTIIQNDYRDETGKPIQKSPKVLKYLNPIAMMAVSGARGNVDQIRQLGGMRGLMAKPSGEIIETPIKSNFREGLSVLEYFSSTHGARKGLADTALKTADSGYLTRKLADVAQNVIINEIECGTANGVTKSTIYKGEQVEVELKDMIVGRTALDTIRNPITDETIVSANQILTNEIADKLKELKLESIRVRSPLTCESPRGICANCYGIDMSTNRLVEEGLAVGIIAAQSIGEPGTQLTMRTFHTGGVATGTLIENDIKSVAGGTVKHHDINAVEVKVEEGGKKLVALKRNGEIAIEDAKGREIERYKVPYGATITAADGEKVKPRQQLVVWDPHITPILAEKGGIIRYEDIEEGETARMEEERKGGGGESRLVVIEHKGERHPRLTIEGSDGKILDFHYLPAKARIEVKNGQKIEAGHLLARQPRESAGTQDITGGLPRVTEIFEARKPKDPAVLAEISGTVELRSDKRRGKMTITVRAESGMEKEHHVPQDKELQVHTGDFVEAGDALIRGPLVPHDIIRIKGEESLYQYLLTEVQNVYRSQGVKINDKHIEIILNQMLRKVKVEDAGDTKFLPGEVVDKFRFRGGNDLVMTSVKIAEAGGTSFKESDVVTKAEFKEANEAAEAAGKEVAKAKKTRPARGKTLLLGITKASLQSESFISAASFQETTKVLTEAALAGAVDTLVGLKENVILGHLIPAGTAFNPHLNLRIKHLAEPPMIEDTEPTPRAPRELPATPAAAPRETVPQAGA
jgi:DNA-directed RNA polymerase subunit beta'